MGKQLDGLVVIGDRLEPCPPDSLNVGHFQFHTSHVVILGRHAIVVRRGDTGKKGKKQGNRLNGLRHVVSDE